MRPRCIIPKPLITKAIDHLTEQKLAQSMINDLQDLSLLLRGEFNFSSFWKIINMWLRITRTPNRFEQSEYEHKIVIKHDMGYKYSLFVECELNMSCINEGLCGY